MDAFFLARIAAKVSGLRLPRVAAYHQSACACGGSCGGTSSCSACDASPTPCACEHRMAAVDAKDAPEYASVEDFVQYMMDDDQAEFTHEDLNVLNFRTKIPVHKIKKELEGYGLTLKVREPEKKVRGITDNPHGTSPFSGMSGGAAYQSVIDSKYGRNPFDDASPKKDDGFRKPFSKD